MSSDADSNFEPNLDILNTLLAMGITENDAKEALFCTGNRSADDAVNYIFNNSNEASRRSTPNSMHAASKQSNKEEAEGQDQASAANDDDEWEDEDLAYYKMTFVVNTSLKMGTGKIAAQVAHACLGLFRHMIESNKMEEAAQWEEMGEKKIVLKGESTEHLVDLYNKAKDAKIPAYLVRDAGHTQIPSGSITVLSLFGFEEDVDKISGKLSLL